MEISPSLLIITNYLLLSCFSSVPRTTASEAHNNFTDLQSLLAFKSQVSDPFGILSTNWTTNTSLCSWIGITCDPRSRQRVTVLYLRDITLHGSISPYLGNLSFLSLLNLVNCSLTGSIPSSLGRLPRLKSLILQQNSLTGPIPTTIFNMSSLVELHVPYNTLSGSLPSNGTFRMLPSIQTLSLSRNQFTGEISSLVGCKDLRSISLSYNEFSGNIPHGLGSLVELTEILFGTNRFTGTIPTSLGNLTKLDSLGLDNNRLTGAIPDEFRNLKSLYRINLELNEFTGSFPTAILNASSLQILFMGDNNFSGQVPIGIGRTLPLLTMLHLGSNQLIGGLEFLSSLTNCRNLQKLGIEDNELEGVLPDSVGNLSMNLQIFYAYGNHIEGAIPSTLGNLSGLIAFSLENNTLTGQIPIALAKMNGLQVMCINGNKISGSIPFEMGMMTSMYILQLQTNALSGPIPDSIGNISTMQHMWMYNNLLSSSIPQRLWSIEGLIELDLSMNDLNGSIPLQVSNLKFLTSLKLSTNQLSGIIPNTLGKLQMLAHLDLSNNSFDGQIPQSFGTLLSVTYLNLSHNILSGSIPAPLFNLSNLRSLDLSFNKLEGRIPEGRVLSNINISSLIGNAALCGAPQLNFPPCSNIQTPNSIRKLNSLKYILPIVAFGIVVLTSMYIIFRFSRKRKARPPTQSDMPCLDDHKMVSYHELVRATDNFSQDNLLGRGSFGSVFKGKLDDGLIVAIKVLNLEVEGASKSFDAECQGLRTIRHRNLVKIISVCSNLDFKALILEFMPNGSLDEWLHSNSHCLDLLQRLNILIDVSFAIEHLHHHHTHTVLHCDLKPSNILLDEEMVAHVSDFGIAKLLCGDGMSMVSASTPGTTGYIAPEYGSTGSVTRMSDVYSFGILLLETITTKKPTDDMFGEEKSLREWICRAHYNAEILDVVDQNLLRDNTGNEQIFNMCRCLASVIELGLLCSSYSPKERVPMKDVVPRLQRIKMEYLLGLEK